MLLAELRVDFFGSTPSTSGVRHNGATAWVAKWNGRWTFASLKFAPLCKSLHITAWAGSRASLAAKWLQTVWA